MRKLALLLLLLIITAATGIAQGISVRSDGIFRNNELYAKLEKTGSGNASYKVKLPKGADILTARYDDWTHTYIITFPQSGQQIAMKNEPGFEQRLAKGVVESNMVVGGQYNPNSEAFFMTRYGYGSIPPVDKQDIPQTESPAKKQDYATVERNRKMPYVGADSYIKQDGKVIGIYKVELQNNKGKNLKVFTFYLPNSTKVAVVSVDEVKNGECKVTTMKDNKEYTIGLKNNDNMFTAREIAIFLSDKGYL